MCQFKWAKVVPCHRRDLEVQEFWLLQRLTDSWLASKSQGPICLGFPGTGIASTHLPGCFTWILGIYNSICKWICVNPELNLSFEHKTSVDEGDLEWPLGFWIPWEHLLFLFGSFPVKGSGEPHERSSWESFQTCGLHLSWLSFPVGSNKAQTHLRALDLSF